MLILKKNKRDDISNFFSNFSLRLPLFLFIFSLSLSFLFSLLVTLSYLSTPSFAFTLSGVISCSSICSTTNCACVTNCTEGYFNIYSNSICTGVPVKKIIISNGNITFAPTETTYIKILCSDGSVSQCFRVNISSSLVTTTTSTTAVSTSTTTTTKVLANCPYECCVGETSYKNKFCPSEQTCTNNVCVVTKSDCPNECCVDDSDYTDKFCENDEASCVEGKCVSPGPSISYSLIGIIAAIIVIVVLAFFFLRGQFGGKRIDSYEELKKKWGKRQSR